jgi:hypothetical protein
VTASLPNFDTDRHIGCPFFVQEGQFSSVAVNSVRKALVW